MENPSKSGKTLRKYGRDYLLQLRMHPFSLQKPQDLPTLEVIKDRLYLHQIDNISSQPVTDPPTSYYTDRYHCMMKPETYNKYAHQQRSLPGYLSSRSGSYYSSNQKYNPTVPTSKYRSTTYSPPYYYTSQKQYRATTAPYKSDLSTEDFFENITDIQTAPFYKESYPAYTAENAWNLNQKVFETKSCSSQQDGIPPKSKKKLPIIDPVTGKDILDSISPTNSQISLESKENTEETEMLSSDVIEENFEDSQKMVFMQGDMNNFRNSPVDALPEDQFPYMPASSKQSGDSAVPSLNQVDSDEEFSKEYSANKSDLCMKSNAEGGDSDKNVYKNFNFTEAFASQESSYSASNMEFSVENNSGFNDGPDPFENKNQTSKNVKYSQAASKVLNETKQETTETNLKEKIIMLRDKMYCMKQEQQKMAIMQSFLRFKKHQLDETFRNLDEKKIDIVNWEYTLYTKAQKLHDKEHWLETKNKHLLSKEKQLEDREKWVEKKIKEIKSKHGELLNEKNELEKDVTENYLHKENSASKDDIESRWEKIQQFEDNEIIKAIAEKNAASQTEDYLSGDIPKANPELIKDEKTKFYEHKFKHETTPYPKQNVSITSKGRKYFPEHIKYSLNQKDRKKEMLTKDSYDDTHTEEKRYLPQSIKFSSNQTDMKKREFKGIEHKEFERKMDISYRNNNNKNSETMDMKSKVSLDSKEDSSINLSESEKVPSSYEKKSFDKSSLKRYKALFSEGKKYFHEDMKYLLNQKDKKINETILQCKDDSSSKNETLGKNTFTKKSYEFEDAADAVRKYSRNRNISLNKSTIREVKNLVSEGRKYFPEYLKFHLNLKDKSIKESGLQCEEESVPLDSNLLESVKQERNSEGRKYLSEYNRAIISTIEQDEETSDSNKDTYGNIESGKIALTTEENLKFDEKQQDVAMSASSNNLFSNIETSNEIEENKRLKDSSGVTKISCKRPKIYLSSGTSDWPNANSTVKEQTPSEERKYFPEQIKYCLNQKDKKFQENNSQNLTNLASESDSCKNTKSLDKTEATIKIKDVKRDDTPFKPKIGSSSEVFGIQTAHQNDQRIRSKEIPSNAKETNKRKPTTSEGRKYLPEHMKYYVNYKEKLNESHIQKRRDVSEIQKEEKVNLQDTNEECSILGKSSVFAFGDVPETTPAPCKAKNTYSSNKSTLSEGKKYLPENVKYSMPQKERN